MEAMNWPEAFVGAVVVLSIAWVAVTWIKVKSGNTSGNGNEEND